MENEYPISLYETTFTLAEVESVTGVNKKNIRNWLDRDVIRLRIDDFSAGGGKRLFAPIDIMKIATLGELTKQVQMAPSTAWEATQLAERRAKEIMDSSVDAPDIANGSRDPQFAILQMMDDQLLVGHIRQSQIHKNNWIHACVLLPLDRIIFDTLEELYEVRAKEAGEFEGRSLIDHKIKFAELTLEKDELFELLESENREPTADEELKILELNTEIVRSKSVLGKTQ